MIVVADAGPLIHLSLVSSFDLLPSLYHQVLIPDLVYDDRPARLAAEALGFHVKGSLGVLVEAKRGGLIPAVAPLLRQLQDRGVWLAEDLIARVLRDLKEMI